MKKNSSQKLQRSVRTDKSTLPRLTDRQTTDKFINFFFLSIVFFIPLVFNRNLEDSFSLPKITLLIILLTVIIGLLLFEKKFQKKTFFNSNSKEITFSFFKNCPWFLNLAIFLFLFQSLLAIIFSIIPEVSFWGYAKRWDGFVTWIVYFTLFYLTIYLVKTNSQIDSSDDQQTSRNKTAEKILIKKKFILTEKIFFWAIAASFISFFYALLQYFDKDPFKWGTDFGTRVFSTLANPDFLGGYMAMIFPLSLYFYFSREGKIFQKKIFFSGLAIIAIFSTILFAQTRGAFIGFIAGIIAFFFLNGTKFFWQRKAKLFTLIIILFILSICFGGNIFKRLTTETFDQSVKNISGKKIEERVYIWEKTIEIIKDHPCFGIGPDNLRFIFNNYEKTTDIQFHSYTTVDRVHNDLLEITVSRGIPGLIFYLFIFINLICVAWKNFSVKNRSSAGISVHLSAQTNADKSDEKKEKQEKLLIATLVSSMIAYFVQNQFSFNTIALSSLFWILAGCLTSFCSVILSHPSPDRHRKKNLISKFFFASWPNECHPDSPVNEERSKSEIFFRQLAKIRWPSKFLKMSFPQFLGFAFFIIFLFFTFYFLKTSLADFYCKKGINIGLLICKDTKFCVFTEKEIYFHQKALKTKPQTHLYQEKLVVASFKHISQIQEKKIFYLQKLIKEIEKLISLNPKNGFYWRPLGIAYFQLAEEENREYAIPLMDIEVTQKSIISSSTISSELSKKDLEKAKEIFQKVIELTPTLAFSYSDLGKISFKEKNYPEAENLFEQALKIKAQSFDAGNNLENLLSPIFELTKEYFDQGENEKAIALLKKVLNYFPSNLETHRNLGVVYYKIENFEKAKKEFEIVIKANPKDEEIKKALSVIPVKTGIQN